MADYVAVLKKTIDGLGETTPETREKVYDRARGTIGAKLAALSPPPPAAVVERQKKALEDAILSVEAEYASAKPASAVDDDLESIFASLDQPRSKETAQPGAAAPVAAGAVATPPLSTARPASRETEKPGPAPERSDFGREAVLGPEATFADDDGGYAAMPPADHGAATRPARRRGVAGLAIALVVLLAAAGAGYGVWLNRAEFQAMLGLWPTEQQTAEAPPTEIVLPGDEEGTDQGEDETIVEEPTADPAAEEASAEPETEVAAVEPTPEPEPEPEPEPAEPAAPQKFTQRLTPDGNEIDAGPAPGTPGVGEGTSVATAVIPVQAEAETPPAQPAGATAGAEVSPATNETTGGAQPAIAVGQRAIFYEERTTAAQGSAETGSIVWSLVQESPGGDAPPEPAIRAEATIPGKDLQLRMTIRRNRDQTLPASHIVEMIFLTPEDFEGGGIENVLRMTMKSSEEAPGNPLLGIPAKIADGFFLLALTDGEAEIAQNTALLSRDQWIDVPMVYRSGRRALITLEKGIPGSRVFDEAIKAWQSASSG